MINNNSMLLDTNKNIPNNQCDSQNKFQMSNTGGSKFASNGSNLCTTNPSQSNDNSFHNNQIQTNQNIIKPQSNFNKNIEKGVKEINKEKVKERENNNILNLNNSITNHDANNKLNNSINNNFNILNGFAVNPSNNTYGTLPNLNNSLLNNSMSYNSRMMMMKRDIKSPDDIVLTYMSSIRQITDEEIENSPELIVTQEDGNILKKGKGERIIINAAGLVEGGRQARDGIVILGINEKFSHDIDLNLTKNSSYEALKKYPYLCAIYFQKSSKRYYIKACSGGEKDSEILFIKLHKNYVYPMTEIEFIFIANSVFQLIPLQDGTLEISILAAKKNVTDVTKNIYRRQEVITIGKESNCTYSFPDEKCVSHINTTIYYDDKINGWVIRDGDKKSKPSTNGTWLFGMHSFPITDGLVVEFLTCKLVFELKKGIGMLGDDEKK